MPPGCALLGGFAIGARDALLWQHSANDKCQRVLVLALCLFHLVLWVVREINPRRQAAGVTVCI